MNPTPRTPWKPEVSGGSDQNDAETQARVGDAMRGCVVWMLPSVRFEETASCQPDSYRRSAHANRWDRPLATSPFSISGVLPTGNQARYHFAVAVLKGRGKRASFGVRGMCVAVWVFRRRRPRLRDIPRHCLGGSSQMAGG